MSSKLPPSKSDRRPVVNSIQKHRYDTVIKINDLGLTLTTANAILDISTKQVAGSPPNERKQNMNTPAIGDTFTTQASGVTGTVEEVIENKTGSLRVRLSLANGEDRWTTVKK